MLSPSTIRGYRPIQRNAFRTVMSTPLNALPNDLLQNAVNAECKRTTGKANHPKQISSKTIINEYGCYITIKEVIVYDENNKPVIKNKGM